MCSLHCKRMDTVIKEVNLSCFYKDFCPGSHNYLNTEHLRSSPVCVLNCFSVINVKIYNFTNLRTYLLNSEAF